MRSRHPRAGRRQPATKQLEALRAIGGEIARELDLPSLLSLLHRRVVELVAAASGAVYLWDEGTELLVPAAWHGIGEWFAEVRLRLGQGVAGAVAQRRRGMIVNEYPGSPLALALLVEEIGIAAVLAEPLVYRERLVGVITINRRRGEEPFGDEERRLLALFADQAAIAIANAQAHAAALRRADELAALLRASRSIMAGLDLQEILDRIVTEAGPIAGTSHVKLLLVDKPAQALRVGARSGATLAKETAFPIGTGLSGWVAATGAPLFVPECHLDPRNIFAGHDRAVGFRTYLGLPIKGRDEVLGVLTFSTTEPRRYTVEEVAYLTSFADQAAVALENARLYRVVRDRATEVETLRDIERAITSHLELPAVLDAVTAGAMRLLRSRAAEVLLWDEPGQCLRSGEAPLAGSEGREGVPDVVARTRQPLILDDYQASPYAAPERAGVVATITVPILFGERLLGVLHSHTTDAGRRFTVEDLRRLRSLAAQSAIAIENARLFARVAQAKAEWEHTFDAIPDLVAIIDGESRLLRANRALAVRAGRTPDALVGQHCYAVLHGRECPWPGCPHEHTLATGQPATQVMEDPYLGGTFLVTTAPLPGAAGRAPGSVHIARDITELRRLEAQARERQRIEDLSRAKSAFIASMSHELRSPLNAILGFSQLLLEQAGTELSEQQVRYAGNIHKSGQHLLQLITDILDLSRIEVGKLTLRLASIPVAQTLDDILAIARGLANQKGQVIAITVAPDLPPLVADLLRVKQILFNLLSNAVKFTPPGGRILVTAWRRGGEEAESLLGIRTARSPGAPAGEWLELAVADTGAGIRPEDLPRLFGEFVQLETTRAQAHEGSGLGLALTKRLVELHGGRISAASHGEGRGSTFTVWLPFNGPEAQREERRA